MNPNTTTVALSGDDTFVLNDRIFADFADGNIAELTYPNEIANAKTGKNGNTIYSFNATGKQAELKLRLIRGSADDKFMNNLLAQQQENFAGTILMDAELTKKIGDGKGKITSDIYVISGGIFTKNVDAKSNAEGDTEQSVAIYTMKFSNAPREIS